MKEPCKESRCLRYPICIQKETMYCKLFNLYVSYYVTKILKFRNADTGLFVSEKCRRDLWDHVEIIFPKMKSIIMSEYNDEPDSYVYQIDKPEKSNILILSYGRPSERPM